MNPLIYQLHTPEEFRYLSSFGHWVVGYIFLGIFIISLLQALGYLKNKKYLWSALMIASGLIFIPFNLLHHGLNELPLVWKVIETDPQQRQHFVMFNLLFIAGTVELLISTNKLKARGWKFVWPGVLLIIGSLFLVHPQHGSAEARVASQVFHTILGTVILITGLLRASEIVWVRRYAWLKFGWLFFLLITSLLLITYNEPKGAYQMDSPSLMNGVQH